MSSLYNKYRPKSFDEMIGNQIAIKAIQKTLGKTHVYLLSGPPGTGKTTSARIIAKELESDGMDIREINSANSRGIDTAREITQAIKLLPIASKCIVYILDEAHRWTADFSNAMLKVLEDTPNHVYFILCTTESNKIIKAIKSRTTEIQFINLKNTEIVLLLKKVCKNEKLNISLEVLEEISNTCEGSPRNALVLLEKVLGIENEEEALKIIKNGIVDENDTEIIELARGLINEKNGWSVISKILKRLSENGKLDNPENVRYIVLGYMNSILLSGKLNNRAVAALEAFSEPTYNTGKNGITLACLNTIS